MDKLINNPICEGCRSDCRCGKEKRPHYHQDGKIILLCDQCRDRQAEIKERFKVKG